jgi:hypothetical protein
VQVDEEVEVPLKDEVAAINEKLDLVLEELRAMKEEAAPKE